MFPADQVPHVLDWDEIDRLVDHLMPQFEGEFDGIVMITQGGMIPGGILCEAMGIKNVHTAAIHTVETAQEQMVWPTFLQFPIDALVTGKRLLVVDDIWAKGTNMVMVKSRLEATGAKAETAVLHFRPKDNLFPDIGPDYYGAITDEEIVYPWRPPHLHGGYGLPSSMRR